MSQPMTYRFMIAGGGTGGHIFPAIAIAEAIRVLEPSSEFLFVGALGKMEMEKVPAAGYRIEGLPIAGYNRSSLFKNIGLPLKLIRSFWKVASLFKSFKPHAVIGVGGYSTYPVLRYAQSSGIPTFIHESNSFAGKSNILLGKKATRIFTCGEGMESFFPADRILVTGNPIRKAILNQSHDRDQAVTSFGLDPQKPVVLCVGGSLGARSINEAVREGLPQLDEKNIQLIWQTGSLFFPQAETYRRSGRWIAPFIEQMDRAYAAADVVISRSGAMSVSELCVSGKPVVFVPYPHAAENHQQANALRLVNQGAALMVNDHEVSQQLIPAVVDLAGDPAKRASFTAAIKKLAIRDADTTIAQSILETIKKQ